MKEFEFGAMKMTWFEKNFQQEQKKKIIHTAFIVRGLFFLLTKSLLRFHIYGKLKHWEGTTS